MYFAETSTLCPLYFAQKAVFPYIFCLECVFVCIYCAETCTLSPLYFAQMQFFFHCILARMILSIYFAESIRFSPLYFGEAVPGWGLSWQVYPATTSYPASTSLRISRCTRGAQKNELPPWIFANMQFVANVFRLHHIPLSPFVARCHFFLIICLPKCSYIEQQRVHTRRPIRWAATLNLWKNATIFGCVVYLLLMYFASITFFFRLFSQDVIFFVIIFPPKCSYVEHHRVHKLNPLPDAPKSSISSTLLFLFLVVLLQPKKATLYTWKWMDDTSLHICMYI